MYLSPQNYRMNSKGNFVANHKIHNFYLRQTLRWKSVCSHVWIVEVSGHYFGHLWSFHTSDLYKGQQPAIAAPVAILNLQIIVLYFTKYKISWSLYIYFCNIIIWILEVSFSVNRKSTNYIYMYDIAYSVKYIFLAT
jgi:hypothetical protein